MRRLEAKSIIERCLGPEVYRALRARGLRAEKTVDRLQARASQRIVNFGLRDARGNTVYKHGVSWSVVQQMTFAQALEANCRMVTDVLDKSGVSWWLVENTPSRHAVIGVDVESRDTILQALSSLDSEAPVYASGIEAPIVLRHVSTISKSMDLKSADVINVLAPRAVVDSTLEYGIATACQIEFWRFGDEEQVTAPRENRASRVISREDFLLVEDDPSISSARVPSVLKKRMLDDVIFPVDAVYTWVDGEDPDWIKSKHRTESEIAGVEYHGEANHIARFRSRDELKYSLRSLEMYAPWFRNIFIVTAGQVPEWLNTDHPKIKLVDHRDIYPDASYLPTFNSNSIISRLHHIQGLSEHYVYINDDVFFGRPLAKDRFFLPSGIAKVSPSRNRRPFGSPTAHDEPHLNLTRNMRALLERDFGVTISRAIKHTPHPQLRSVHFEMESKYAEAYEQTWSSRFRHHQDIVADQLHHYYAQIVGKAVPTNLRYNYINILDDQYRGTMQNTLRLRHRDTFCINDAPVDGATPIPDDEVTNFLENYFPVKSSFEN
ncbi:capsular biosynthesis protein [Arthrobacter sp. AQ5-05]|nr:capsular biosynthesis protein [Arthrobacter sp. AQ5-05]